jgi:HlyD family secretion protein
MKPYRITLALLVLLAGCSKQDDGVWLGYAEADYIYVAAPAAGWVTRLGVERGVVVKTGMALFTLDTENQTANRDQAVAAIAEADHQLAAAEVAHDLAARELKRQEALLKTGATSRQLYDQAKSSFDSDAADVERIKATRDSARASLAGAAYNLSQRTIVARAGGRVEDIYFRPGEYASAQTPVISLLPPGNVYVRFFVPESEYAKLKLGQKVKVSCDGCQPIAATVTFISSSYEYAPPVVFSIASRDKLVFKVEARVPGGIPLHPGQPVDVRPL